MSKIRGISFKLSKAILPGRKLAGHADEPGICEHLTGTEHFLTVNEELMREQQCPAALFDGNAKAIYQQLSSADGVLQK